MSWPDPVLRQFNKIPLNPTEADFHGPYNKLLAALFPPDSRYTVIPRYWPGSRESGDPVFTFEVVLDDPDRTILILLLRRPADLRLLSRRAVADQQIRQRMVDVNDCPLPTLRAVSAMGTKLCFYDRPRKGPVNPHNIYPVSDVTTDVAPRERWDCDVLEEDGMTRFQAIMDEIKKGCEVLEVNDTFLSLDD